MRTVTLSDGKTMEVGPMTGKRVRASNAPDKKDWIEEMFANLDAVGIGADVTDEMPFPDIMKLSQAVVAETFGLPEEEKN